MSPQGSTSTRASIVAAATMFLRDRRYGRERGFEQQAQQEQTMFVTQISTQTQKGADIHLALNAFCASKLGSREAGNMVVTYGP
jgi:hypothetical protein